MMRASLSVVMAATCTACAIWLAECLAEPSGPVLEGTARAVVTLQPAVAAHRAREYAEAFDAAGEVEDLDPLLLVALAHRESSFRLRVIRGHRTGPAGAVGLLQIMPRGAPLRWAPAGCRRRQVDPACSIATGAGYLAHLRDDPETDPEGGCPGSWWRWTGSYRYRSCLSERQARRDIGARRLRRLYLQVGGEDWR